jgi:hypothetical protein
MRIKHPQLLLIVAVALGLSCSCGAPDGEVHPARAQPAQQDREGTVDASNTIEGAGATATPAPAPDASMRQRNFEAFPESPSGIYSPRLAAFETVIHIPIPPESRLGLTIQNTPVTGRSHIRFGENLTLEQRAQVERFLRGAQSVVDFAWESGDLLEIRFDGSASRAKLVGNGADKMLVAGTLRPRGFLPAMLSERICAMFAAAMPTGRTAEATRWACRGDLGGLEKLAETELDANEDRALEQLSKLAFQAPVEPEQPDGTVSSVELELLASMTHALFDGAPVSALEIITPEIRRTCHRERGTRCRLMFVLAQGAYEQALAKLATNVAQNSRYIVQLRLEHGWAHPKDIAHELVMIEADALRRAGHHEEAVNTYENLLSRLSYGGEELVLTSLAGTYRDGNDPFRALAVTDYQEEKFRSARR